MDVSDMLEVLRTCVDANQVLQPWPEEMSDFSVEQPVSHQAVFPIHSDRNFGCRGTHHEIATTQTAYAPTCGSSRGRAERFRNCRSSHLRRESGAQRHVVVCRGSTAENRCLYLRQASVAGPGTGYRMVEGGHPAWSHRRHIGRWFPQIRVAQGGQSRL